MLVDLIDPVALVFILIAVVWPVASVLDGRR
jgi:hypothetical protein